VKRAAKKQKRTGIPAESRFIEKFDRLWREHAVESFDFGFAILDPSTGLRTGFRLSVIG
jgi:hypothetical protein